MTRATGLLALLTILLGFVSSVFFPPVALAQIEPPGVIVNGSALITAEPLRQVSGEWTLPLRSVAQRVGSEIRVENNEAGLRVRRSNGTDIHYDALSGEIRDRFLLIGRISSYREIQLNNSNPELMFPMSGVVALLDIEARFDADRNLIVVESNPQSSARTGSDRPSWTLADMDYVYGLNTNFKQTGHISALRSHGMLGSTKITQNLTTNLTPNGGLQFVQASVRLDNRSSAFTLGDQAATPEIEFLSAPVRGAGYEREIGGFRSSFYGGRSRRTSHTDSIGFSTGTDGYNTNVAGFSLNRNSARRQFTLAGNAFNDSSSKGMTLGAAFGHLSSMNQFRAFAGVGHFSKGLGTGVSVSDAFSPLRQISLTGTVEHYGANFLSVREDVRFHGNSAASGSVTVRPVSFITATTGLSYRQFTSGNKGSIENRSYSVTGNVPGRFPLILGVFKSSNVDSTSAAQGVEINQYSVSIPYFKRYSMYSNYSVMRTGAERIETLTATAGMETSSYGRVGLRSQIQLRHSSTIGFDWQMPIRKADQYLRLGLERTQSIGNRPVLRPVLGFNLPVGKGRSLQLNYTSDNGSRSLQLTLRAPLFSKSKIVTDDRGVTSVVRPSSLMGRVFADVDTNGKFDESVDRPIPDIRVWLDDDKSVTTDARGTFRFDEVVAGAHRLRAEIKSLPADLVFAETDTRVVNVLPGRDNGVQFRVVRTGRVSGKLTYMDYTEDPRTPVERPMADGRLVIIRTDLDSYAEANGSFLFGDLTPGVYELRVAPETIPAGYVSLPASVRVEVKAGQTTERVHFTIQQPPRLIVEKALP